MAKILKTVGIKPQQGTILIQAITSFVGAGRYDIEGVIGDVYLVDSVNEHYDLFCYCKRLGPDKKLETSLDKRFRLAYKNEVILWKKH